MHYEKFPNGSMINVLDPQVSITGTGIIIIILLNYRTQITVIHTPSSVL